MRPNQGNAFTCAGFSNWKKQHTSVKKHEMSVAHANAKIAEALFLQDRNIVCSLERQVQEDKVRRKREVVSNRDVMKRVVDAIVLLGNQGLAFRGHRESLTCTDNTGNFIAVLEFLSIYDATIRDHLEKVRQQQKSENSTGSTVKRKGSRVMKARGR